MPLTSRVGDGSSGRRPSSQYGLRGDAMAISARHQLLSDAWTADVEDLESAIGRFEPDPTGRTTARLCFLRSQATGTSTAT
jgi:hypothetical protein